LAGDTKSNTETIKACGIWDEWDDERGGGDIGPGKGSHGAHGTARTRHDRSVANVVGMDRKNPDSGRLIVTRESRHDVDKMALRRAKSLYSSMSPVGGSHAKLDSAPTTK